MPRKALQIKANRVPAAKKGSILAFTTHQSPADLLRSKDGLKQGRIETFMENKRPTIKPISQEKKRPLSGDGIIPETPLPKVLKSSHKSASSTKNSFGQKYSQSAILDYTKEAHYSDRHPKRKAISSRFHKLNKTPKIKLQSTEHGTVRIQPKHKLTQTSLPVRVDNGHHSKFESPVLSEHFEPAKLEKRAPSEHLEAVESCSNEPTDNEVQAIKQSDNVKGHLESSEIQSKEVVKNCENAPSIDDLCFDDSFLNAALDDMSPVKENKSTNSTAKMLPFRISSSSASHSLTKYRFDVLSVAESTDISGFATKMLELENAASKMKLNCTLHDSWVDTKIAESDVVNLIASDEELSNGQEVKVDSKKNLVILQPDVLISGTTVSNAIGCKRRAILNERFRNTENADSGKPVMLIGTIVHSLFQSVLQKRQTWNHEAILSLVKAEVSKPIILKDIIALGTTQNEILNSVKTFIPSILSWAKEYVRDSATIGVGNLDIRLPPGYKNDNLAIDSTHGRSIFPTNAALTEVKDIEENIWSPLYGLKGKIDVTGGFLVRRQDTEKKPRITKLILPLELKTGRASQSTEHHAQVAIYSMFCKQRYQNRMEDCDTVPAGLLLYLKTGNLSCVPLKRDDERELSIIRNSIVSCITKSVIENSQNGVATFQPATLPPTIDNERFCTNCSQLRNCSLVYEAVDKKQAAFHPSSMMQQLFNAQTSHLNSKDFEYFNHWVTCTLLETRKSMKGDLNQYYWLRSPEERQDAGSCVTNLVLAGHGKLSQDGVTSLQTFKKSAVCKESEINFSKFAEGDLVVVSGEEPAFVAMATGTMSSVTENFLTISTDRQFEAYPKDMKYSIDKHQWPSVSSFKASFHNLSVIMQSTTRANRLRGLIIHHKEPTFKVNIQDVIPRESKGDIGKMMRGLNRTQRQAIKRVLLSNDYTLVVGMPGSGKTTTIVALVRILLLCGCRVLLTSYTHSAIDNLLIKMMKYKIKFLRLGRLSQIHPSVQQFSEETLSEGMSTPEELEKLYSDARVVGCTCLAVTSHALFTSPGDQETKRSRFDVCIVDEASQISQPACLAPLLHADRFVLVGDHRQLPPLVRSRKAKSIGADESLFWRLCHHKAALCDLTLQYRMNKEIMDVSNYVTYEGRLECVSETIATAKLDLPQWKEVAEVIAKLHEPIVVYEHRILDTSWLFTSVDPENAVVFLDTSNLKAYEEDVENGICNKTEADILKLIVDYLIQAGCSSDNIGVIAPFRKQLKTIEESLSTLPHNTNDIEINTVDKYQGRDKRVILMSFVRSRCEELVGDKAGELLGDWRRLNVALTRAKHKMILVGCQKTLSAYEPCKKMLMYLNDHRVIVTL